MVASSGFQIFCIQPNPFGFFLSKLPFHFWEEDGVLCSRQCMLVAQITVAAMVLAARHYLDERPVTLKMLLTSSRVLSVEFTYFPFVHVPVTLFFRGDSALFSASNLLLRTCAFISYGLCSVVSHYFSFFFAHGVLHLCWVLISIYSLLQKPMSEVIDSPYLLVGRYLPF